MSAVLVASVGWPFLEDVEASEMPVRRSVRASPAARPATMGADATAMLQAYERTGGLLDSDEAMLLLRRHTSQPVSLLARWIVQQRVLSFEWESERLFPVFQFDRSHMSVRSEVSAVLLELSGTFDDWELAAWFATPNSWLGDAAPLDVLETDLAAVLDAARADRYIARG
jgi:hypothetical protein